MMTTREPQIRVVVCAAIRKHNITILGVRHFDQFMREAVIASGQNFNDWQQGFVDNKYNFLTREEALAVAKEAGQIRRQCGGDSKQLFSENLY